MAKYKKSLGTVKIITPEPAFRDYIRAELLNFKAWNPEFVKEVKDNVFIFQNKDEILWKIELIRTGFIICSLQPVVYLRHGIKIFMGSSRIEIS